MIYTLISRIPAVADYKYGNIITFVIGTVVYALLHYFANRDDAPEFIKEYKNLLYLVSVLDIGVYYASCKGLIPGLRPRHVSERTARVQQQHKSNDACDDDICKLKDLHQQLQDHQASDRNNKERTSDEPVASDDESRSDTTIPAFIEESTSHAEDDVEAGID